MSRMTLENLICGRVESPLRELVYGAEKVGKTTWAAGSPSPVFLCGEDGSNEFDVARFPTPHTFREVGDAVKVLLETEHTFKTLVVDSLDWIEPLIWRAVCDAGGKGSIEDFGYGKGYSMALDYWRTFLGDLEVLQHRKGMGVILLAHSWIKPFSNPEGDDYDRFELKLHKKTAALCKEWAHSVLFAKLDVEVKKESYKDRKGKARGRAKRVLCTSSHPAYEAGSRYGLPEKLPLEFAAFEKAWKKGRGK